MICLGLDSISAADLGSTTAESAGNRYRVMFGGIDALFFHDGEGKDSLVLLLDQIGQLTGIKS
jgi:hypothetical protein